jgi:hypothetical protein
MFPLAILLPTRNCMPRLAAHIQSMGPWLDLAQEIVVVDSESTDGTPEYVRRHVPGARLVTHPPGLYESWNAGIRQITAPYTYISTIGDGITREGLAHLHAVACRQHADVVVSPPDFVDEAGHPRDSNNWPVHDLIDALQLSQDVCFEGLPLFLLALAYVPFAILGSSASNLYRTEALRRLPFPTEFGRNGDGAWGLLNALAIRLAVTPRRVSFFRRHQRAYAPAEYQAVDGDQRMLDAAMKMLAWRLEADPGLREDAQGPEVDRLIRAKLTVQSWRVRLQSHRRRPFPWIFNPGALYARYQRQAAQRRCMELLRLYLRDHIQPIPGALHPA